MINMADITKTLLKRFEELGFARQYIDNGEYQKMFQGITHRKGPVLMREQKSEGIPSQREYVVLLPTEDAWKKSYGKNHELTVLEAKSYSPFTGFSSMSFADFDKDGNGMTGNADSLKFALFSPYGIYQQ
jgi:hypothetical protein